MAFKFKPIHLLLGSAMLAMLAIASLCLAILPSYISGRRAENGPNPSVDFPPVPEKPATMPIAKKKAEVELTLLPDRKEIIPFEPFSLTVRLRNISGKDLVTAQGIWSTLVYHVSFEREAVFDTWNINYGFRPDDITIKAGEKTEINDALIYRDNPRTRKEPIRFVFTKPGKYRVHATIDRDYAWQEPDRGSILSDAIEVTVRAANASDEAATRLILSSGLGRYLEDGLDEKTIATAISLADRFPTSVHADYLHLAIATYYRRESLGPHRKDEHLTTAIDHAKKVSTRDARLRKKALSMRLNAVSWETGKWWEEERVALLAEVERYIKPGGSFDEFEKGAYTSVLRRIKDMVEFSKGGILWLMRSSIEEPQLGGFDGTFVNAMQTTRGDFEASIPKIREAMKDPDSKMRLLASYALARLDSADTTGIDYLVATIKDQNSALRADAIYLTRDRPDYPPLIEALIPVLKEKDARLRFMAIQRLLEGKGKSNPQIQTAIVDLLGDPDLVYRLKVAEIARERGDAKLALPVFLIALKEGNPIQKRIAASNLRRMGDLAKVAIPLLIESLGDKHQDEHHRLRIFAATTLASFGRDAKDAVPALREALSEPNPDILNAVRNALKAVQGEE